MIVTSSGVFAEAIGAQSNYPININGDNINRTLSHITGVESTKEEESSLPSDYDSFSRRFKNIVLMKAAQDKDSVILKEDDNDSAKSDTGLNTEDNKSDISEDDSTIDNDQQKDILTGATSDLSADSSEYVDPETEDYPDDSFFDIQTPEEDEIIHSYELSDDSQESEERTGSEITYEYSWLNDQDSPQEITIFSPLNQELEFVSASDNGIYQENMEFPEEGGEVLYDYNGVVVWNLGEQPAGASGTVTLTAQNNSSLPEDEIDNTEFVQVGDEQITSKQNDSDSSSDSDSNVEIEKEQSVNDGSATTDSLEINSEDEVTYYISVENTGGSTATDVVITDTVPEGLTYVEDTASDGADIQDDIITWSIGDLEAGADSYQVSFTCQVPDVADEDMYYSNTAEVDWNENSGSPVSSNSVEASSPTVSENESDTDNNSTNLENNSTDITGSGSTSDPTPNYQGSDNSATTPTSDYGSLIINPDRDDIQSNPNTIVTESPKTGVVNLNGLCFALILSSVAVLMILNRKKRRNPFKD